MDYISIEQKPHHFVKVNLTSLKDKDGIYDLYKCEYCGLLGKRYGFLNSLLVDVTLKKVKLCDGRKIEEENKETQILEKVEKVKIIKDLCIFGAENLHKGDIVDIVRKSERGVWVKGEEATPEKKKLDPNYNGEVLLLFNEFMYLR